LHELIFRRARTLTNGAAVTANDDDELVLAPEWHAVDEAFLHAATAYGAPELMPSSDAELLTAAWTQLA
jgi:hypothetical protein